MAGYRLKNKVTLEINSQALVTFLIKENVSIYGKAPKNLQFLALNLFMFFP